MKMNTTKPKYWIFSNRHVGAYGDSDWDTSTILKTKRYYFGEKLPNRSYVKQGDIVMLRTFGEGFWGTCEIKEDWVSDPDGESKHGRKTGWFQIKNIKKWKTFLPYKIIRNDLLNRNHRFRIGKSNEEEKNKIEFALKIYQ